MSQLAFFPAHRITTAGRTARDIPEPRILPEALEAAVQNAADALITLQKPDGHWVFELEADATIPAEYILLRHFFGEGDPEEEAAIARHLRRTQAEHGGWPLFHGGAFNMSATVKAYFALKMIGDDVDARHMRRAREAILVRGGAARSNVFTRFLLALFGVVPWHTTPVMPVEIMLLPRWFPFHLSKISYWARTVLVPLLVIQACRPRAANPRGTNIAELFTESPEHIREWPDGPHQTWPWAHVFRTVDRVLQRVSPWFPQFTRRKAIAAAEAFVNERLNGLDGLGAIFPAMSNALIMYHCLGVSPDDPRVRTGWKAIEKLIHQRNNETYVQPCLSPIWDTALACHAIMEAKGPEASPQLGRALDWLIDHQETKVIGDWAVMRPDIAPGGWAFQYSNPHYPDLDDTAVVVLALDRARAAFGYTGQHVDTAIDQAVTWTVGMQSSNGGWGAFDADNDNEYLNHIPFADHGALLDPPTADVTGRCVAMLGQLGRRGDNPVVAAGLRFLEQDQEADGSWYGRWGVNYVYGTWSVLTALNAIDTPPEAAIVRRGVAFLLAHQNPDGGWGEDGASYALDPDQRPKSRNSTPSQTAWALLGLMAAGEHANVATARGIEYLLKTQGENGFWPEEAYTGTGFPRVFYLRYHGYARFFPLWCLARYRNLCHKNSGKVEVGL